MIDLSSIHRSRAFRCRESLNRDVVKKYYERFKYYKRGFDSNYPFPAILVWYNGRRYILLGGYHRVAAARKAEMGTILAKIIRGSADDAFAMALKDNSTHGLPLNKKDLKLCIRKAKERFPDKNGDEIAKMVGCCRAYAYRILKEISENKKGTNREQQTKTEENIFYKPVRPLQSTDTLCIASEQPQESISNTPLYRKVKEVKESLPVGDVILDTPVGEKKEPIEAFIESLDTFMQNLSQSSDRDLFHHKVVDWCDRWKKHQS